MDISISILFADTLFIVFNPREKASQESLVLGNVFSTDLANGMVPTLSGENKITVDLTSGVKINDSNVIAADIQGANGVVHVIDKVLIPE